MGESLGQSETGRLEPLCEAQGGRGRRKARIRIGRGAAGIERAEARFLGQAFAPHRHDLYAIGITLFGVQRFRYRGEERLCLPGQCHILHPDELHDGGAATEEGFGYRMLYVDPSLVQQALAGKPLPFVRSPVIDAAWLPPGFAEAWDIDAELDELAATQIAVAAAQLLVAAAGEAQARSAGLAVAQLTRIRDLIAASPARLHSAEELERLSGLDRWTIARQFRTLFGTSPSRFRTLRRLDEVRRLLRGGMPLAMASAEAGFADQSHMSRRFKRAYGLTPAAWAAAIA
jgi:AraC-like DNA-binding protein